MILTLVPSVTNAAGLIPCGGRNENPCTICYLIVGFNGIINKMLYLSFFIALAVLAFASVMYIVSAGDSGATGMAKNAMKNATIGIVVMFSAWIIVNYTMQLLGTKPGLGIENIGGWDKFQCEGQVANTGQAININTSAPTTNNSSGSSATSSLAVLGAPCGNENLGVCYDGNWTTPCPGSQTWIRGGTSCASGLYCCAQSGKEGDKCGRRIEDTDICKPITNPPCERSSNFATIGTYYPRCGSGLDCCR